MQIVIDIPENIYEAIKDSKSIFFNGQRNGKTLLSILVTGVWNGTPLPKGHGDLIDKDRLLDELEKTVKSVDDTNRHLLFWDRTVAHVHLSKPIIEADKEGSGDT